MAPTDDELFAQMRTALTDERFDDFERLGAEAERRQAEREARLSALGALAAAALWYAGQGLAVFPVSVRAKRPLIPAAHAADSPERLTCRGECGQDGHGLHDATTDISIVRRWWASWPQANVGLCTGLLFDVIDVDGPTGYASYFDLRDAGRLPTVYGWARTPGNRNDKRPPGAHLYIASTGDGNGASFMPGLDYRGAGGYVLAAPSIAGDGERYDWITPLDVDGLRATR